MSATASAQRSRLTITGSYNRGQTITFAISDATPLTQTLLLYGRPGATTTDLGSLGSLTAELSAPFDLLPVGLTDATGRLSLTVDVPADAPQPSDNSLTLQVVSVKPQGQQLLFLTSNVAELVSGDGGALAAVRRWNQHTIDATGLDHAANPAQPGPGRASRAMAIAHIAMFEALLAIDGGFDSYLDLTPVSTEQPYQNPFTPSAPHSPAASRGPPC